MLYTQEHGIPKIFNRSMKGMYAIHSTQRNTIAVTLGNPCKILEFLHVKPGKGSAFVRTKVKNLITGNSLEKTFRAVSLVV